MWRRQMQVKDLAPAIGATAVSLGRKLRGERTWTIDEVLAVARALNVPITDLLPEDDYDPAPYGRGRVGCAIRDSNPEPAD
ncbi:helix-turn-helix domain-containing protein [Tsukamurella strandjordii]|uniref:helix-turn-helix domain-containing protein n=1 Tax=Tsukamurella strandjordii TaxID=147577 RepID=UPI003CD09C47